MWPEQPRKLSCLCLYYPRYHGWSDCRYPRQVWGNRFEVTTLPKFCGYLVGVDVVVVDVVVVVIDIVVIMSFERSCKVIIMLKKSCKISQNVSLNRAKTRLLLSFDLYLSYTHSTYYDNLDPLDINVLPLKDAPLPGARGNTMSASPKHR